jgi:hypothetical protein
MAALKARVHNGRLVLDVPSSLPEGTVLDLVVDDHGEDLDPGERVTLIAAIDEGLADADAGRVVDASVVLEALRARR